MTGSFDFLRLAELVGQEGEAAPGDFSSERVPYLAARLGLSEQATRQMFYGHRRYLGWLRADRLAVAAGYHPVNVWPEEWLDFLQAAA